MALIRNYNLKFDIKYRKTEIFESEHSYQLGIDGSINDEMVQAFEEEFNCTFHSVMPYCKMGGGHWILLVFNKG